MLMDGAKRGPHYGDLFLSAVELIFEPPKRMGLCESKGDRRYDYECL